MIELIDVSKHYASKQGNVKAIDNLSLQIHDNEIFGIVGESGAGKSTLLRFINLLERPDTGEILIDGIPMRQLSPEELRLQKKSISMIFQNFNLLNNKTVEENILLPLQLHSFEESLDLERVLKFVRLDDKRHQYPSQLSGGQKQRVGIARALITKPKVLLCDEPTSALDETRTFEIVNLIKRAHEEFDMTVVLVTHELDVVQQLCDRVVILEEGRMIDLVEHEPRIKDEFNLTYHQRVLEALE